MTYTIGIVQPRQFIEPGLEVSTYFDFGAVRPLYYFNAFATGAPIHTN